MMALDNSFHFLHQPLLEWDTQTFETRDANQQLNPPAMETPVSDCVGDETVSWKRRIITPPSSFDDSFETCEDLNEIFQNFWDASGFGEVSNDVNGIMHERNNLLLESPNIQPITELHVQSLSSDSSEIVSLPLDPTNQNHFSKPPLPAISSSPIKNCTIRDKENVRGKKRSREPAMAVLCPFVVVKPGGTGTDGCVTLDDINKKLLMRPARPVRHPVGDFACVPRVSASGPGLSGKAVVSLTRIYTRGRGTITIIRTKG